MTPLEIGILIHYYTNSGDYHDGDFHAPAVRDAIDRFYKCGLLKRRDAMVDSYEGTKGLKMYVEALEAVPLPELLWVMPDQETDWQEFLREQECV